MNFESIANNLLPPKLAWRVTRRTRELRELREFSAFYGMFLQSGDLCFDIGANLGNRTRSFRHLGCRVVAVEPQRHCFTQLQRQFGKDDHVTLIHKALGNAPGEAQLHVSPNHVLSSFSTTFIDRTKESGRFATARWDRTEMACLTTLDALIAEYGMPGFIKIDVEGSESEVLAGLSFPVPALSIEWVPEFPENTRSCLLHLADMADYEFNLSWGESMRFTRTRWRSLQSILTVIEEFEGETLLFGDIYARLKA